MLSSKSWNIYTMNTNKPLSASNHSKQLTSVFANLTVEKATYPLTVQEIAEAQQKDKMLFESSKYDGFHSQLVENVMVLCNPGKLVITQDLQHGAVEWYHCYLQHPDSIHLKETLWSAMYWKGMQHSVHAYVKKCHKCQVNK